MSSPVRFASAAALTLACSLFVTARAGVISNSDAELQYQLANLLFDETRYWEALQAFERASEAPDQALALRALKGKVRTELRVAEFAMARADAEKVKAAAPTDPEALTLYADSLWAGGMFDEADVVYRDALAVAPDSSRARFGIARSLATRNHLDDALNEALAASAARSRSSSATRSWPFLASHRSMRTTRFGQFAPPSSCAMQISELNLELTRDRGLRVEFRIGVNTGPVVAGSRDAGSALGTGDAVNVAARLEQSAPIGAILVGQSTFQLVRDQVRSEPAEPVAAKGKTEPITARLLLGMAAGGLRWPLTRKAMWSTPIGRAIDIDRVSSPPG